MSRLKTECFWVKMAMLFFDIIIISTRACEFANPRPGSQLKTKGNYIPVFYFDCEKYKFLYF